MSSKRPGWKRRNPYIIDENKRVHMANLAVYGSSYTNGVAAIHSQILKDDLFKEWYALYPERFDCLEICFEDPVFSAVYSGESSATPLSPVLQSSLQN